MSISNNALIFYHTYTIKSKKKSVYSTDFSIKTSFSLEYRDGFERLLGCDRAGGNKVPGLTRRRQAEARLFLGEE